MSYDTFCLAPCDEGPVALEARSPTSGDIAQAMHEIGNMWEFPKSGSILVVLNIRCRKVIYNPKGSIVLRATHESPQLEHESFTHDLGLRL